MRRTLVLGLALATSALHSQTTKIPAASEHENPQDSSMIHAGKYDISVQLRRRMTAPLARLVGDQKSFWRMAPNLSKDDLGWLLPLASGTAAVAASDGWIARQISPRAASPSRKLSRNATFSLAGLAAGGFLVGKLQRNEHLSEAGLLSGEAVANSLAVSESLKMVVRRERPSRVGIPSSYGSLPSSHAAFAWAAASVWAHEYSGPLSKVLAYGLASTITATRITSRQHFASDALVGSAIGWYFGRQVYVEHHDRELGGAAWGGISVEPSALWSGSGSSYVPNDSWVYGAFEQLIAAGLISDAYLGVRPWTRIECARLLEEAEESLGDEDNERRQQHQFIARLQEEFNSDSERVEGQRQFDASLDSLYVRGATLFGAALTDGFHFGQTVINDYGRPFAEGFNSVTGFSAHADAGPFAFLMKGEFQHSPALAPSPQQILAATADVDGVLPFSNARAEFNRFELLESTVGYAIKGVMVTFGRQSLWLGPEETGPLLFSNNAAPMLMLRFASASPYRVPLLSRWMGSAESEFFLGRVAGQTWEYSPQLYGPGLRSQPFLHGSKWSFHPTRNLEIGMGLTAQFGGPGNPFTWSNFSRTFYSHRVGVGRNPGKRLSQFDISYRVPGVRNWLQAYCDLMVIDEYSPIGSTRPAMISGLYFPRLPKLPRLDLRIEGATTDLNVPSHYGPGAFYWDDRYRSGYTNEGNLIGSWVGRRARVQQGWLTYHFSARDTLQLGYRHNNVDQGFLGGGELRDFGMQGEMKINGHLQLSARMQQERWRFSLLSLAAKSNFLSSIQLTFSPKSFSKDKN